MSPAGFPIAAARQVLASAKEHIGKRESFAVETTLAGKHYLQMMVDARIRGFEVVFDNSTEEGYRLIAVLGPSGNKWFEPVPDWAKASQ